MADRERTFRFIVDLGAAMHRYGASTARIEAGLARLSSHFDLDGQFFSTPTALMASFGHAGGQTFLVRLDPPAVVDLSKLTRLDTLLTGLLRGNIAPAAGQKELDAILVSTSRGDQQILLVAGQTLAAAAAGRLIGGGWREIGVAAGIGFTNALLAHAAASRRRLDRVQVPLASFVAALLAASAARFVSPLNAQVAMLAGLVVLLPGLMLTTAMTELATGHLASGSARFAGACVVLVTMAFGVALGTHVASALVGTVNFTPPLQLPGWTLGLALLLAPLAVAALFRAPRREIPFSVAGALLAYAGAAFGQRLFGAELGVFVGGLTAGIAANVYARWRNRPSAIVYVPALLLLVPGIVGFRSVTALLASDVTRGIDIAFTTLLMAVALVTGMLLSSVLVSPRRVL
jgi:uncharacterized membrane protein YjjP (DUF1212 family)